MPDRGEGGRENLFCLAWVEQELTPLLFVLRPVQFRNSPTRPQLVSYETAHYLPLVSRVPGCISYTLLRSTVVLKRSKLVIFVTAGTTSSTTSTAKEDASNSVTSCYFSSFC